MKRPRPMQQAPSGSPPPETCDAPIGSPEYHRWRSARALWSRWRKDQLRLAARDRYAGKPRAPMLRPPSMPEPPETCPYQVGSPEYHRWRGARARWAQYRRAVRCPDTAAA
jgi:hypothetical protein